MSFIKKWFFPFVFLFALFSEQLFYSFMSLNGIATESGFLKYIFLIVFAFSLFVFFLDFDDYLNDASYSIVIIILISILFLYSLTGLLHSDSNEGYSSALLRFGVICVPCAIIGIHLAKTQCFDEIVLLLPYFIIPISLILGSVGVKYAIVGEITHNESGINYQNLSYYMAEMYAYSFYYLYLSSLKGTLIHNILRIPMLCVMIFCVIICTTGGGRGAMLFMVLVTFYLLYRLFKNNETNTLLICIGIMVVALLGIYAAIHFDVFNSVGFNRVKNGLNINNRYFWPLAWDAFLDSPIIGHGLGSIWYMLGSYSHNLFLDLLAETGIIGTTIMSIFLFSFIYFIEKISTYSKFHLFVLLIFLKSFIMSLLSGYWIETYQFFLAFGFYMYSFKKEDENI